jgi:hypothetical protein
MIVVVLTLVLHPLVDHLEVVPRSHTVLYMIAHQIPQLLSEQ